MVVVRYQETLEMVAAGMADIRVHHYLTQLGGYHRPTADHSVRVAQRAVDTAFDLRYHPTEKLYVPTNEELLQLARGALLHDIGKLYTPLEILEKPAALTADEEKIMKLHTIDGYTILRNGFENEPEQFIALTHHEWKAKPHRRSGIIDRREQHRSIPDRRSYEPTSRTELSKIVAAADIVDALAVKRVYQPSVLSVADIARLEYNGNRSYLDRILEAA
jgi:putative nucleotidyltransferase with HDIG domain